MWVFYNFLTSSANSRHLGYFCHLIIFHDSCTILHFSLVKYDGSNFSMSFSTHFIITSILVGVTWYFYLLLPNDCWCWISLHVYICISSLENFLFKFFVHFATELLVTMFSFACKCLNNMCSPWSPIMYLRVNWTAESEVAPVTPWPACSWI